MLLTIAVKGNHFTTSLYQVVISRVLLSSDLPDRYISNEGVNLLPLKGFSQIDDYLQQF